MQSGFGGVSEIQQFMMDGSAAHTLFSISSTTPPPPNPSASAASGQELRFPAASAPAHKFINPFHPHLHHPPPPPAPSYFSHFHSIPITQQLFTPPPQPHHHHHFQLFHPDPENSGCPPLHPGGGGATPSFLAASMNFKLAVDNGSGGGGGIQDGLNNDTDVAGGILQGDDASESRLPPWHREEDCAIKEPFWRPLDLDYINRNNKRCKDKEPAVDVGHFVKRSRESGELKNFHAVAAASAAADGNYKIFSELEAIYKPGGSNSTTSEGATNNNNNTTNQTTGSGSALTGDDHPAMPLATTAAAAPKPDSHLDDDNSNSTGGEAHTNSKAARHTSRRRRRRRQHQMGSIVAFFEGLVKQVMDQQEALHEKFLDAMERRDRERTRREETWWEQEAARAQREAAARTHDRVIAAAREATIISFLEKITGETLQLPTHPQLLSSAAAGGGEEKEYNAELCVPSPAMMTTSRWPKAEVQALIRVRSGFEGRFQEPGLKGPMWEEVSGAMAALGYRRSAKRCKEKWENINKYFRKAKDSGRKRPQQSKTCTYFHQLDQLYSKAGLTKSASPPRRGDGENNLINSCELLDADILVGAVERQGFGEGEEVGESEGGKRAEEEEAEESSPCFERLQ